VVVELVDIQEMVVMVDTIMGTAGVQVDLDLVVQVVVDLLLEVKFMVEVEVV
jgi:hypothetical protein|tara:strand:- start:192 stop:347 length:156 start_codon:yes stop_codon:yes gene_type:complete